MSWYPVLVLQCMHPLPHSIHLSIYAGKHARPYAFTYTHAPMTTCKRIYIYLYTCISACRGRKRVKANTVYQDHVADREHVHMNSTKWSTLTDFVIYLGKKNAALVDNTEKGKVGDMRAVRRAQYVPCVSVLCRVYGLWCTVCVYTASVCAHECTYNIYI